ncbi:helix-turn-helix domain-containing protein [Sporomusa sp. KB1]|jgi:predicted transcriptional regulator|uniref:helix-turn-helix domain-containing protein n=1 Tax=Sporomusa sp. KB1 TaxID=943346 RepID=UPI0011A79246|nr:helix-turn-helix domain-containing protein [Sporomusa sp. KB1]TWH45929.1 Transcriptional regulators [Sporomusa sp. KB1]
MSPCEIKAMLVYNGVKITEIASCLGVSQAAVSRTIQGHTVSAKIRQAIAEKIGRQVEEVWPEQAA